MSVDGPVATERIGYRFFLQPPPVSATVTAIDGIDDFSDHPGWTPSASTRARVPPSTGGTAPATTSWPWSARPPTMQQLQAVDRLLHQEVTVTYSDVRHLSDGAAVRPGRRPWTREAAPDGAEGPLRVDVRPVNNMPDAALAPPSDSSLGLLDAASGRETVVVTRHTCRGAPGRAGRRPDRRRSTVPLDDLFATRPTGWS